MIMIKQKTGDGVRFVGKNLFALLITHPVTGNPEINGLVIKEWKLQTNSTH